MTQPNESGWVTLGHSLTRARLQARLSKRAAAQRAGFSEATWRQLEIGHKAVAPGVVIAMSARAETVVAAARAVGIDPSEALSMVGFDATADLLAEVPAPVDPITRLAEELVAEMQGVRNELRALKDAIALLVPAQPAPPPPEEDRRAHP